MIVNDIHFYVNDQRKCVYFSMGSIVVNSNGVRIKSIKLDQKSSYYIEFSTLLNGVYKHHHYEAYSSNQRKFIKHMINGTTVNNFRYENEIDFKQKLEQIYDLSGINK